jgi:hypothetical protein
MIDGVDTTSRRPISINGCTKKRLRFPSRLVASDRGTREKAIRVLCRWFSAQPRLSDRTLLKIWKALFYCMWICDKPAIQQDLARKLALIMHRMNHGQELDYVDAFLKTIGREWHGIDRFRLDKYYYLIRMVLHETFEYLKKKSWSRESVQSFGMLLEYNLLSNDNVKAPQSLKYFITEIFLDKLQCFLDYPIPAELFDPFIRAIATSHVSYLNRLKMCIFDRILGMCRTSKENLPTKNLLPDETIQSIGDSLRKLVDQEEMCRTNRKYLIEILKSYDEICSKTLPAKVKMGKAQCDMIWDRLYLFFDRRRTKRTFLPVIFSARPDNSLSRPKNPEPASFRMTPRCRPDLLRTHCLGRIVMKK